MIIQYEILDKPINGYKYRLGAPLRYYSKRYDKFVYIEEGFLSDGASGPANDIASVGWWVHDKLCVTHKWADGTYCSAWQASMVLFDILWDENRYVRAILWSPFTFIWQKSRGHK